MTRIVRNGVVFVALAVVLSAGQARAQLMPPDGVPRITQADFKKLQASGGVITVDTRLADAYRNGHIPGAILLPLEGLASWPREFEKTVEMLKAAKKPIATYCA